MIDTVFVLLESKNSSQMSIWYLVMPIISMAAAFIIMFVKDWIITKKHEKRDRISKALENSLESTIRLLHIFIKAEDNPDYLEDENIENKINTLNVKINLSTIYLPKKLYDSTRRVVLLIQKYADSLEKNHGVLDNLYREIVSNLKQYREEIREYTNKTY